MWILFGMLWVWLGIKLVVMLIDRRKDERG